MARNNSRRRKLVEGCDAVIDQWKYEIAAELGITGISGGLMDDVEFADELGMSGGSSVIQGSYWGNVATRDTGTVGGSITARLVKQAEEVLHGMR